MNRIYVLANLSRKPGLSVICKRLLPWLRRVADVVKVDWNGDTDLQQINAELILVFGGDGSIISAARRLRGNPIPVMGVNMGQLGFLAETSPDELRKTL